MTRSHRAAHFAVNGLFLDHPQTGTGVYTREVLARLLPISPGSAGFQPAPRGPAAGDRRDALAHKTGEGRLEAGGPRDVGTRYTIIGHPDHAHEFRGRAPYVSVQGPGQHRAEKLEKVWWEQVTLPAAVARLRADLLYAPYFSLPLRTTARTVVTIHDLIPLILPEYAPSAAFKAYFRLVSAATRRADAVVTDSRCSADDIVRLLGVPRERVHVVYLGVDRRYGQPIPPGEIAALRARLELPERFMLYLGGTDPRKNVGVLLRAARLLRDSGRHTLPLVMAVPRGGRFADPRDEAATLGLGTPEVVFLDRLAEADLPAMYAAAAAFAWPSRYEGFGLPPLEAMASGTPVISSDAASLPEVVGDAGLLLAPDDVDAWAGAMERIADDEALRQDLAERGRARAAAFTWDATAAGLRGVFQNVLQAG